MMNVGGIMSDIMAQITLIFSCIILAILIVGATEIILDIIGYLVSKNE